MTANRYKDLYQSYFFTWVLIPALLFCMGIRPPATAAFITAPWVHGGHCSADGPRHSPCPGQGVLSG